MKKYMKYMFVVAMLTTSINVFSQTTTVTYKPNATIGKDAVIEIGGIANYYDNINYGSLPELAINDMPLGTRSWLKSRSLIEFDQLNSIPSNAVITNAVLKFYGVPSSTNFPQGNYPVCEDRCLINNDVWLQRITSSWNESTVTWNNQPSSTTTDRVKIYQSSSQWNYNATITSSLTIAPNLINMLNIMRNTTNNGFLMILDNETTNRSMLFASSDHSNSALWPELTVTYEIIGCEFTTCVSTTDQGIFTFSAVNTYGNHTWNIYDNNDITTPISTTNLTSFNYSFPQVGDYYIEHIVNTANQSCTTSVSLCVDQTQISNISAKTTKVENILDATNTPLEITKSNTIKVYPNPSSDDWNVTLTSENAENVDVIVTDCVGKVVSNDKKNLTKGDNSFVIDGSKLPKGTYILEIKGGTTNFTQKLSKN